ncbi:ATP-dependent DNA helicase homolog RECG, chloroplastic [Phoenix dactylifera]|uniref:DNA 3'-5' helicase n=1 Tax=Phoenix dactylifera TaxID=42345 RepID=A0A8B9A8P5_PHODC|nr:ATP-dependent DNA helicase homolog RECG, chloroplastic [Phoenix dactylifera]XP_038983015.1 ATP-dependent DNA helicase homolog RECG, chloroplastic [Phoenix dactylifera]
MAQLVTSFVQLCCKGFSERHLRSAICFEVERGYCNTFVRTMRFSKFLHYNLLTWCSRSNHMFARKLLEEVGGYSTANMLERSKFLYKVSVSMGYSNIQDLIDQEITQRESGADVSGMMEDSDFLLTCGKFPCIKLGDSSLVELYDEVPHPQEQVNFLLPKACKRYLSDSEEKWAGSDKFNETWQLSAPPLSNITSLSSGEESSYMVYDSREADSDGEAKLDAEGSSEVPSVQTIMPAELVLDKTVRCIPGTTSRRGRQLEDSGFYTVRKLLHHFPRTYADLQNGQGEIDGGHFVMFVGKILSSRGIKASPSFSFLEVVIGCELQNNEPVMEIKNDGCSTEEKKMVYLHLKKFFRGTRFTCLPFLKSIQSKYREGDHVYVSGKVKKMRMENHYEMREYNIDMLEEEEEQHAHVERRPYPLYPSKAGLKPDFLRDIISRALKILTSNIDPMPHEILKEFNLLNLYDAYMGIHRPSNINEADLARRRLIFDEFFYLQLGRLFQMLAALGTWVEKEELLDKYKQHGLNVVCIEEWSDLTKMLLKTLPYSLTPSQLNAVSEIIWDLKRPVPMNRLLQGDVGCGKTVVAFLACMEVIGSGFQAAFMVPTELLAVQHYEHLVSLLENIGGDQSKPSVALLTGSTSAKQSRIILKGLQTGDIAMVIGTHSLIAEKVEFSALRIAVVDEQHRFGVIQRGRFNSKLYSISPSLRMNCTNSDESSEDKSLMAPHVLAMSATPIPRTLALALYGDMSLTQITDLPPGRTPVETFVLEGNEIGFEKVFQMMRDELITGGKVYLVYPVIEESEQLPQLRAVTADLASISEKFKGYQCGLLHGRLKSEEKDGALRKFRSGETRILLATQVIEIGVDVPDASLMVVMNAERFGVAQLHQLRGRVGRGARKSKCIFLSSTSGTLDRLKVLEKSSDGFYLANADLLLRGPGNLLGKKQSGHLPEFPIARLEVDGNILQEAHLAALKVLGTSNDLESFPKLKAELSMRQPLSILGD